MNSATLAANQQLEERGFFTIAWMNDELPQIGSQYDEPIDGLAGPVFIFAEGNVDDFIEQNRKYNPEGLLQASIAADYAKAFFRVRAE